MLPILREADSLEDVNIIKGLENKLNMILKQVDEFKTLLESIYDYNKNMTHTGNQYYFSDKLYDAAFRAGDLQNEKPDVNMDDAFEEYCDAIYEDFELMLSELGEDFQTIFTLDNHHGSYFKFNPDEIELDNLFRGDNPIEVIKIAMNYMNEHIGPYPSNLDYTLSNAKVENNHITLSTIDESELEDAEYLVEDFNVYIETLKDNYDLCNKIIQDYNQIKSNQVADFDSMFE